MSKTKSNRPSVARKPARLAVTLGDATSIGPEVGLSAIHKFLKKDKKTKIEIFAPRQFQKKISKTVLHALESGQVFWTDNEREHVFKVGHPSHFSAGRALRDLDHAIDSILCKRNHHLVTGPVDKALCQKINPEFKGHTEYLQKRSGAKGTTMLLAGASLRVALVTTHIALKDVSKSLTEQKIIDTALRVNEFFKRGSKNPSLAVCGLNPHASDNGLFGSEEKKTIAPAIRKLQKKGLRIFGPLSADSLFHKAQRYDAIICHYHDQGLIPLKMKHFYDAVNITLGLPFVRTSVDHGTAFDIAGKGVANDESFYNALTYARDSKIY